MAVLVLGCSEANDGTSSADDSASGGAATYGGATAGGGSSGTGGAAPAGVGGTTGGATAAGGATGSGGATSAGGTTSTGGATAGGANGIDGGTSGTGGTAPGGTGGTTGGATSTGGTQSVPTYSLRVDEPQSGATVSGVVSVRGFAPGFVNVEVWDATHQQPPLAQTAPNPDGSFSTTIDTLSVATGPTTWTVWAWDSAPGQPFAHNANVGVPLTILRNTGPGAGGTTGSGGAPSTGGTPGTGGTPSTTDGRNFLLGMFSSGSEITSYASYLGYHPELTYNSSYQDDHHKSCGQPISGLNDIKNYPVIASVFTYNADYAGTAAGQHDGCYETVFSGLEAKANTIYAIRIDVEFWPHPPANDFKGSFNRIVSIAKKHLPARIKYVFNPNWEAGLGAGYVPESADIIGPDAYNNPQWCSGKSGAQCAADKFDPNHPGSIAYWTKIAQQLGKPMALPEWGDDYGDGAYITAVADWAYDKVLVTPGKSNNVVYIGYWDSNFNEDAHLRGNAKTVFQQRFGNMPYSGTYWGSLLPTTSYGAF